MNQSLKSSELEKIIVAGLTGTSFMTLFSYAASEIKKGNFKEPELLGRLLHALTPQLDKKVTQLAGWHLHYFVGFIFCFLYAKVWERTSIQPSLRSGVALGGLSGLVGQAVWKLCFKVHPCPPKINFRKFNGHLLIAHLIFGAFAVIGYKLLKGHNNNPSYQGISE